MQIVSQFIAYFLGKIRKIIQNVSAEIFINSAKCNCTSQVSQMSWGSRYDIDPTSIDPTPIPTPSSFLEKTSIFEFGQVHCCKQGCLSN